MNKIEQLKDRIRLWEDEMNMEGAPENAGDAAEVDLGSEIDKNIPIEPLLKRFLLKKSVLASYLSKKQRGEIPCGIPDMDGKEFIQRFVVMWAQLLEQQGKTDEVREKLLKEEPIEGWQ